MHEKFSHRDIYGMDTDTYVKVQSKKSIKELILIYKRDIEILRAHRDIISDRYRDLEIDYKNTNSVSHTVDKLDMLEDLLTVVVRKIDSRKASIERLKQFLGEIE